MKKDWIKRTPADYVTTAWSGGTTTQLLIAPEEAKYAERNFLWRVSSAAVALEESDFTLLPDYERLIATLRGEITLTHNGGTPIRLRPYEAHAFSGADRTHCVGRCTDFNLMLRRGRAEGSMEAVTLGAGSQKDFPADGADQTLLYAAEGACAVRVGAEQITLQSGESLICGKGIDWGVVSEEAAVLVICRMRRL